MLCGKCSGTGRYLGIGFMMTECTDCTEKNYQTETPSLESINRKSSSYLKAIRDIMKLNPEITRKEAVRMFDEAYVKS